MKVHGGRVVCPCEEEEQRHGWELLERGANSVCWAAKCSWHVLCPGFAGADKVYSVALNGRKRGTSENPVCLLFLKLNK